MHTTIRRGLAVLALFCLALAPQAAHALITGGEGNTPINDPGWTKGAEVVFNHTARVAWWEGPPFGGGNWHGEYRGDAKALNAALADFAKIDSKNKSIIVHDGVGHSFWLNPNRAAEKKEASKIDWTFSVWQPASWERHRALPADLRGIGEPKDAEKGPPVQLEIYAGGNIRWADVKLPEGISISDHRLEAHGFKLGDGSVIEGTATDVATQKPLAAKVRLESVEPQKTGGYAHKTVLETVADQDGKWVLKKVPAGWHRIVIEHAGYVPRLVGYAQHDGQPRWSEYHGSLSTAMTVSGLVTDDEGNPLAEVNVRLGNVVAADESRYESNAGYEVKTDPDGRFHFAQVPAGSASVWVHKPGYCRPGLGENIKTPVEDMTLKMQKSASITITVGFGAKERPAGYIAHLSPEGGAKVGKWSGSGNIDTSNQITYKDVPPGRYVVVGHPNPHSEPEKTDPVEVELKGGEHTEVTITAK